MIRHATELCRFTRALGGDFVWACPERCDHWNDWRVKALTSNPGAFATSALSAVDWHFVGDARVYIKKMWVFVSTDPAVTETFALFHIDPNADNKTFVGCFGRMAKASAHYPKLFVELF